MPATPQRNIRVPDDVWQAAQLTAVDRGESVTAAINRFLAEYGGVTPAARPPAQTIAAIARRGAAAATE